MNVKELKTYKDNLYSALSRDLSEFEKNFILISTGILAFTITFIKDLIKVDESKNICLLVFAWILIIVSIGLMMYTFIMSAKASDDLFKEVDDYIITNKLFDESKTLDDSQAVDIKTRINGIFYQRKKILRNFRLGAIASFILGITILSFFVYDNLNQITKKNKYNEHIIKISITDTAKFDSSHFKVTYEKFK